MPSIRKLNPLKRARSHFSDLRDQSALVGLYQEAGGRHYELHFVSLILFDFVSLRDRERLVGLVAEDFVLIGHL